MAVDFAVFSVYYIRSHGDIIHTVGSCRLAQHTMTSFIQSAAVGPAHDDIIHTVGSCLHIAQPTVFANSTKECQLFGWNVSTPRKSLGVGRNLCEGLANTRRHVYGEVPTLAALQAMPPPSKPQPATPTSQSQAPAPPPPRNPLASPPAVSSSPIHLPVVPFQTPPTSQLTTPTSQ